MTTNIINNNISLTYNNSNARAADERSEALNNTAISEKSPLIPSNVSAEPTYSLTAKDISLSVPGVLYESILLIFLIALAPVILSLSLISKIDKEWFSGDPDSITNKKIPIVLVHGSGFNKIQWMFFRFILKLRGHTGHIFSLNLNEGSFFNDKKDIGEYARDRLAKKIDSIKKRYKDEAHLDMDQVILVGHSMGGMVSAKYALHLAEDVKVKAIVAISTPWWGSSIARAFFEPTDKPEGAFFPDHEPSKKLREDLLEKERKGEIQLFTVSSTLDPLVRPHSSTLPIKPENQILSYVHDHYTSMLDPWLPSVIHDRWLAPLSKEPLPELGKEK